MGVKLFFFNANTIIPGHTCEHTIINRILLGHLEIRNFSSHVEKIFFNTRIEISYLRAAM